MQGLVLQLTRAGFLLLLWLFIFSVLRILRTDIYAPTGSVMAAPRPDVARSARRPPGDGPRPAIWWSPRERWREPDHPGFPARADRPGR